MKTKKNTTKKETPIYLIFSNERDNVCPYCGEGLVPSNTGGYICGAQVSHVQYVKNSDMFASNYYSYIGNHKVEKLGIDELMDN